MIKFLIAIAPVALFPSVGGAIFTFLLLFFLLD